jgi:hypothetical protein
MRKVSQKLPVKMKDTKYSIYQLDPTTTNKEMGAKEMMSFGMCKILKKVY